MVRLLGDFMNRSFLLGFVLRSGLYFGLVFIAILFLGQREEIIWSFSYFATMFALGLALFVPYCFYVYWRFRRRSKDRPRDSFSTLTFFAQGNRAAEIGHGFAQMD